MKINYPSLVKDYKKNGFVVVDDFLPEKIACKLESIFLDNNEWKLMNQTRKDKYSLYKMQSPYFPKENEIYSAKFWRSNKLEKETKNIFDEFFKPALKKICRKELTEYDLRCYKLDKGCYYRTHIDDWLGNIGCIYYINKRWIWDWGGILHVGRDDNSDSIAAIFPKFNRAIFIDHGGFKFPHYISPVTDYALNSRLTMISFNR
jgi:Rps23 Pro-64 3,4-dihydroxylase Tpa1-like proline 4-hydroxylase|tara:strand:+ start:39 stop:650 length:612 start_codon:yes stop_codon:yes gene_type:complete